MRSLFNTNHSQQQYFQKTEGEENFEDLVDEKIQTNAPLIMDNKQKIKNQESTYLLGHTKQVNGKRKTSNNSIQQEKEKQKQIFQFLIEGTVGKTLNCISKDSKLLLTQIQKQQFLISQKIFNPHQYFSPTHSEEGDSTEKQKQQKSSKQDCYLDQQDKENINTSNLPSNKSQQALQTKNNNNKNDISLSQEINAKQKSFQNTKQSNVGKKFIKSNSILGESNQSQKLPKTKEPIIHSQSYLGISQNQQKWGISLKSTNSQFDKFQTGKTSKDNFVTTNSCLGNDKNISELKKEMKLLKNTFSVDQYPTTTTSSSLFSQNSSSPEGSQYYNGESQDKKLINQQQLDESPYYCQAPMKIQQQKMNQVPLQNKNKMLTTNSKVLQNSVDQGQNYQQTINNQYSQSSNDNQIVAGTCLQNKISQEALKFQQQSKKSNSFVNISATARSLGINTTSSQNTRYFQEDFTKMKNDQMFKTSDTFQNATKSYFLDSSNYPPQSNMRVLTEPDVYDSYDFQVDKSKEQLKRMFSSKDNLSTVSSSLSNLSFADAKRNKQNLTYLLQGNTKANDIQKKVQSGNSNQYKPTLNGKYQQIYKEIKLKQSVLNSKSQLPKSSSNQKQSSLQPSKSQKNVNQNKIQQQQQNQQLKYLPQSQTLGYKFISEKVVEEEDELISQQTNVGLYEYTNPQQFQTK